MRSLFERLTFGRTSSFIVEGLVATLPIVFTLLLEAKPTFFDGYQTAMIGVSAILLLLGTSILNYWILSKAGSCTYSPSLHSRRFLSESVVVHLLFATGTVYLGYLLIFVLAGAPLIPELRDLVAGLSLSSLFSVLVVSAHATAVFSLGERAEKDRVVSQYLSESRKFSSTESAIDADEERVLESATILVERFRVEPMRDTDSLKSGLSEWTDAFRKYNVGGRRKMVGSNETNELSQPWAELHNQYQDLCEKLNTLISSGDSRFDGK